MNNAKFINLNCFRTGINIESGFFLQFQQVFASVQTVALLSPDEFVTADYC